MRSRDVDERHDQRALLSITGVVLLVFGLRAALWADFWYGPLIPAWADVPLWSRLVVTVMSTTASLVVLACLRPEREARGRALVLAVMVVSLVGGSVQLLGQWVVGLDNLLDSRSLIADALSVVPQTVVATSIGLGYMVSNRRLRRTERQESESALQIGLALGALQYEEIRVRREVAEGLHGSLQQRLVLLLARIDAILASSASGVPFSDADRRALEQVRRDLEETREVDVRGTSRLLYPEGLEVGMVPAVRSLLGRLPTSIATQLVVDSTVRLMDDPVHPELSQTERLLAVRVVEEGVTNALRHGGATSIGTGLRLENGALVVTVRDNGSGFDSSVPVERSGTERLAARLGLLGGTVELTSRPGEGAVLEARVPLTGAADADGPGADRTSSAVSARRSAGSAVSELGGIVAHALRSR